MSNYGEAITPNTFRIQRLLPGPVERLWAFLTESDQRQQWFAAGEMELREGAVVNFWFQHSRLAPPEEPVPEKYKLPNEGMASAATITRVDPPRLLTLQWDEGEVIFELEPQGDQGLLTITHRNLAHREEMVGVAGGWHKHLDVLSDVLLGRGRQPFWSRISELEAEYDRRLPR